MLIHRFSIKHIYFPCDLEFMRSGYSIHNTKNHFDLHNILSLYILYIFSSKECKGNHGERVERPANDHCDVSIIFPFLSLLLFSKFWSCVDLFYLFLTFSCLFIILLMERPCDCCLLMGTVCLCVDSFCIISMWVTMYVITYNQNE